MVDLLSDDIPEDVYQTLAERAACRGLTLEAYLFAELTRIALARIGEEPAARSLRASRTV